MIAHVLSDERHLRRDYETFIQLKEAADKLQEAFEHIFLDWEAAKRNTRQYLLL